MRSLSAHLPALAPLFVVLLALALCLGTAACSSPPATQPTPLGFFDRAAEGAQQLGAGMNAAGNAIVAGNPVAGGALIGAGTLLSTVCGLFVRRRLVWGVWQDRRGASRRAWREKLPAVVDDGGVEPINPAEPSPPAERIPRAAGPAIAAAA